jgi:hypothetical protein
MLSVARLLLEAADTDAQGALQDGPVGQRLAGTEQHGVGGPDAPCSPLSSPRAAMQLLVQAQEAVALALAKVPMQDLDRGTGGGVGGGAALLRALVARVAEGLALDAFDMVDAATLLASRLAAAPGRTDVGVSTASLWTGALDVAEAAAPAGLVPGTEAAALLRTTVWRRLLLNQPYVAYLCARVSVASDLTRA